MPIRPFGQVLELDVEEAQLIVDVDEVGQSIGVQADPSEDALVRAIRGEPDERGVCDGVRLKDLLGRALEDELEPARRWFLEHVPGGCGLAPRRGMAQTYSAVDRSARRGREPRVMIDPLQRRRPRSSRRSRSAIQAAVGDDLAGLYVYGSYLSGGFDPDGSDLDLVAVLEREVDPGDLARLRPVHDNLLRRYPAWSNRLDIVYIGRAVASGFQIGSRIVRRHQPGRAIPPSNRRRRLAPELVPASRDEPAACRAGRDRVRSADFEGRVHGGADRQVSRSCARVRAVTLEPGFLAYIVLTHCRALMTVRTGAGPSKVAGAAWTAQRMPEWAWLIDAALACRHSGGRQGFDDAATREAASRFLDVIADAIHRPDPARP